MLVNLVLLITFAINATGVFVYWYYRAHRKNKSFVTRYNVLRGNWCEASHNYYACRAFAKILLGRLASAALSFPQLKGTHVLLAGALIMIQLSELWFKTSAESKKFIYPLCTCFAKSSAALSSAIAIIVSFTSSEKSLKARRLFWRGTILLWELFWFISKPKS